MLSKDVPLRLLPLKTLKEAVEGNVNDPISVVAWMTWSSLSRPSAGRDHYMFVHLSDPSLKPEDMRLLRDPSTERDPTEPPYVTCGVFGQQYLLQQLELVEAPVLIHLHQTKMIIYKSKEGTVERQLQVKLRPFRTPQDGDTFALYSASAVAAGYTAAMGDPPLPAAASHGLDRARQHPVDVERLRGLLRWTVEQVRVRQTDPPAQGAGRSAVHAIRQLVPPRAADGVTPVEGSMAPTSLMCKVLAVDFRHVPHHFILHVWDGTDANPTPLFYSSSAPAPPPPNGDAGGGIAAMAVDGADAPAPSAPPPAPHTGRLHMPLASMAQFAGGQEGPFKALADAAAADGEDGAAACGRGGWEVLSVVLDREELPPAGSAVPLVLPAASFQMLPPPQPQLPPNQVPAPVTGDSRGPQWLPRPGDWVLLRDVVPRFVQGQLQLAFQEGRSRLEVTELGGERTAPAHGSGGDGSGGGGLLSPPADPGLWRARVCRPWRALPLRTLRQLLMQQDVCDCSPARVLVRVMAVLNPPLRALPSLAPAPMSAPGSLPQGSDNGGGSSCDDEDAAEVRRALRMAVLPAAALWSQDEVVGTPLDRGGSGRTYALSLLLQDSTASLRAMVLGGAANLFLWGLAPPEEDGAGDAAAAAVAVAAATGAPGAVGAARAGQGPVEQPPSQTAAPSQPSAAEATAGPMSPPAPGIRTTRARAKAAAAAAVARSATSASKLAAAATVTLPKTAGSTPAAATADRDSPGMSAGERFVAALQWLSDQRVPGGGWMEAVLRPGYRDRANPWQSAVYSLEHTVVQLPPHLLGPRRGGGSPPPCM